MGAKKEEWEAKVAEVEEREAGAKERVEEL